MSVRTDGTVECNGCGGDVGNAGVDKAVVVVAMVVTEEGPRPVNLHYCLRADEDGGLYRCAAALLEPGTVVKVVPAELGPDAEFTLWEPPAVPPPNPVAPPAPTPEPEPDPDGKGKDKDRG